MCQRCSHSAPRDRDHEDAFIARPAYGGRRLCNGRSITAILARLLTKPVCRRCPAIRVHFISSTPTPTSRVPVVRRDSDSLDSGLASGRSRSGSITLRPPSVRGKSAIHETRHALRERRQREHLQRVCSATVSVSPPEASIGKVSRQRAPSGRFHSDVTLSPSSPGPTLLNGVRIFDSAPLNTTFVNRQSNQGGRSALILPLLPLTPRTMPPKTTSASLRAHAVHVHRRRHSYRHDGADQQRRIIRHHCRDPGSAGASDSSTTCSAGLPHPRRCPGTRHCTFTSRVRWESF